MCVEVYVPFKFTDSKVSIFDQFYGIQFGYKSQIMLNNFISAVILSAKNEKQNSIDDLFHSVAIEQICSYTFSSIERFWKADTL